jgi:hypothetical protein
MGTEGWKNVHEIAEEMGVVLTNEQAWAIGAAVQRRWEEHHGTLPVKELRPKKNGPGSHCFAVYPPPYHPLIRDLIRAINPDTSPQGRLL